MLCETKKSSSKEQMEAELCIFKIIESLLGISLEANPQIYLADNAFTYIQPDFYSKRSGIIGEIFAHVGKPKKAQDNKIANDILKMLLLEKVQKKEYRKVIVVCDEEEEKHLSGMSALAESIRQFGIEVIRVEISDDLKQKLFEAQNRQKMINA